MSCQRRILRRSWSEFVRNTDVPEASSQPLIETIIANRCHLKLFGHIARFPDSDHVKAILLCACNIREKIPSAPDWKSKSTSNNLYSSHN